MMEQLSFKFDHLVEIVMALAQTAPPARAYRATDNPQFEDFNGVVGAHPHPLNFASPLAKTPPLLETLKDYHDLVEDMVNRKLKRMMNN